MLRVISLGRNPNDDSLNLSASVATSEKILPATLLAAEPNVPTAPVSAPAVRRS